MAMLVSQMYSKDPIQDTDTWSEEPDQENEELAMRLALATRQTREVELESWNNLRQSLEDQERKRRSQ